MGGDGTGWAGRDGRDGSGRVGRGRSGHGSLPSDTVSPPSVSGGGDGVKMSVPPEVMTEWVRYMLLRSETREGGAPAPVFKHEDGGI